MRGFLMSIGLVTGILTSSAYGDVSASRRHVVIVWGGTDQVYGQYLFTVQNTDEEPVNGELPIMLPKEKEDWFPQEGVLPKDVKLGEGGAAELIVKQEFKPGDTFVVFNFTIPASYGKAEMTFQAPYELGDILVMTPVSSQSVDIRSEEMEYKPNQAFAGKNYHMLQTTEIKAGQTLRVTVGGVSEGRARYWWIGSIFGALLLLMGGVLAWRNRPKAEAGGVNVVEESVG